MSCQKKTIPLRAVLVILLSGIFINPTFSSDNIPTPVTDELLQKLGLDRQYHKCISVAERKPSILVLSCAINTYYGCRHGLGSNFYRIKKVGLVSHKRTIRARSKRLCPKVSRSVPLNEHGKR